MWVNVCAHVPRFPLTVFDYRSLMSDCHCSGVPQCVDDLVFWIIHYRARNEESLEVTKSEGETCTHSEFGPIHEPKRFDHYRCLRYGRLARVNERLLFHIKGVTQRCRKMRFSYTQNRRTAAILLTGSHCYKSAIIWEIKRIRFPRVSALLLRRDHKIRHRRHAGSPFHSTWL